ncbi:MAG: M18 family aminopeptidase [Clostridia bacterium]|nr:M18 family aminopeptidase [Clostridia bacterium]
MKQAKTMAKDLLKFIGASPSCYHVIGNFEEMLRAHGYTALPEEAKWDIQPGGKYYVTRNGSSVIAFRVPVSSYAMPSAEQYPGFLMAAAHSDSPTFKIKENPEHPVLGHYVQLNTEKYGGTLMATWFDRPLSVAGRVLVRTEQGIETRFVDVDEDLLVIPSVAIHMNRNANDGMKYQANVDTYPLFGDEADAGAFMDEVANAAGVKKEDILGHDLFLYCRQKGTLVGQRKQFVHSPKLDDVECAWGLMQGFLAADGGASIPVCCVFDNEEVGSETKQGAASTFLRDTLRRIVLGLGGDEEQFVRMLAQSFLVSADNAHARHPNHPEYADGDNAPFMNKGIVIKFNANQRYATDGVSAAIFRAVCQEAGAATQVYANRSDLPGGGTLGSIANTHVPVSTVDIGLAQLAMHSVSETAGVDDLADLCQAMKVYFGKTLVKNNGVYSL